MRVGVAWLDSGIYVCLVRVRDGQAYVDKFVQADGCWSQLVSREDA
jgi:hypothetical protein